MVRSVVETLIGVVVTVDSEQGVLVVQPSEGGAALTLQVDRDPAIAVNDRESELGDLRPGMIVELEYDQTTNIIGAIEADDLRNADEE